MRKVLILFFLVCFGLMAQEFDSANIGDYEKKCAENVANSCFNVGIAYFLGDGFTKNDAKAIEFLKKANKIEPKNPFYISAIAHVYYYNYKKTSKAALLGDAVKLFDAACKLKDAASCYELGEMYNYEDDLLDYSKAASYYKQSCNLKSVDGCLKINSLKNK
ncbi:MAG: sel1 repeat family protein [Campylobacteraceae bacterium]|jgi:TPR repeat protein|nr:sel1 repeat family protein [Campylobacteraceae bacterium]